MSSPRWRSQGLQAAPVPSGTKKQIPLEALSRQRKDRRVTLSTQCGCTEDKSSLTYLSALGDEVMAVWMNRRTADGIYLNFSQVTMIFCWLLAAKLVSYGLQTRNLRWVERWFTVYSAWDCWWSPLPALAQPPQDHVPSPRSPSAP